MRGNWKFVAVLACLLAAVLTPGVRAEDNPTHVWLQGDYLSWYFTRGPLQTPLVTTTTSTDPTTGVGALGQPGTRVLFGSGPVDNHALSGVRLSGGMDFGLGLPFEFSYFRLDQALTNFNANSDTNGSPALGRPIFAAQPPAGEVVFLSSFPGLAVGGIKVRSTDRLWGTDELVCIKLWCDGFSRFDLLAGFRYQQFNESLDISSSTETINSGFAVFFNGGSFGTNSSSTVQDSFKTENHFYGGEVAGRATLLLSNAFTGFSMDIRGGISVGENFQSVDVHGFSTLQTSAGSAATTGGLLAVPSNSGRLTRQEFSVIPEGNFTLNYDLNRHTRFSLGYNVMYWTNVARPGNVINRTVDTRQVATDFTFNAAAGATQPPLQVQNSDIWFQGINVGVLFAY